MTIVTLKSKPLNICPTKLTRLKMPWVGLPQCCVWVFDSVNNSLFKLFVILPIKEPPVLIASKNHTDPMVLMEDLAKPNGFSGWFFY
jgi:hypothetical protein